MNRLDDNGLSENDHEIRDRIAKELDVKGQERRIITNSLRDWHKGWNKVIRASQAQFNLMRRMQEADGHGYCICCCTGRRIHYKALDGGHFISRSKARTRFEPMNVHPQSKASNAHDFGNQDQEQYCLFMINRYGQEEVDALVERSRDKEFTWRDNKELLISSRVLWSRQLKLDKKRIGVAR